MSDMNPPSEGGGGYGGGSYGGGTYGGGASGQPPSGSSGTGYGGPAPSSETKGFFGALFDFSFNTFVTPKIVKIVYVLVTILLALAWIVYVIIGFATEEPAIGVLVLLLGWIPALLYLAFIRMTLEFYYSVVRMSQDINRRLPAGY